MHNPKRFFMAMDQSPRWMNHMSSFHKQRPFEAHHDRHDLFILWICLQDGLYYYCSDSLAPTNFMTDLLSRTIISSSASFVHQESMHSAVQENKPTTDCKDAY
mmetsp:Transcript_21469/g.59665  ORF Transcript_21469/g.59665 Transcript_21469/m.59665 type:complete len:103 (+) Transcript_21469:166-474(+)